MKTTNETISAYADLLIQQYVSKPKARATIEGVVTPFLMPQGDTSTWESTNTLLPLSLRDAFDLSTAVGVQLDILGIYLGVKRSGFNFSGAVTLNDTQYRALLMMMVSRKQLNASLKSIQDFVYNNLNGVVQVFDNLGMRMSWYYKAATGSNVVAEFFIKAGFLPNPLCVGSALVNAYPIGNFFALRTYAAVAPTGTFPLNTYAVYSTSRPWLLYNYAIEV